jgi:hypothetical protein
VAAVKECPNCAVEIRADAEVCPICNYDFPKRAVLPWKPVAAVVLAALLIPLLIRLLRMVGR